MKYYENGYNLYGKSYYKVTSEIFSFALGGYKKIEFFFL